MPDFKVSYYDEDSGRRGVSKVYWVDINGHYFLVTDSYGNFLWVRTSDCRLYKTISSILETL